MSGPHPALPFALLLVLAALVALRGGAVARKAAGPVVAFGRGDDAHDFLGRGFRAVALLLAASFAARLVWPAFDGAAGSVPWLAAPLFGWGGLGLILLGTLLVASAQWQMGRSWRIGLAPEATELVTDGWFRVSRNPVFLGFLAVLAGALLCVPSAVTAALLAAGWLAMSVQARLEEAHLERLHGPAYAEYRARVRRWL
ncbi:MAG: isoprenylcysteine carboxylmethyltransferase family protein [Inquilinus sp.]|nr:isoprenylcysteine carboxylmethyltransferase family protein [Inquilinus sp.]